MLRFKSYTYERLLMIPVDLKNQLQAGTSEFALNQVVDEMDLSIFEGGFRNDEARDERITLHSSGWASPRKLARLRPRFWWQSDPHSAGVFS
jgi:hypothetical protein